MEARTVIIAIFLAAAPIAFGEIAPEVYAAMQRDAPELLQIEVLSADIDREWHKPDSCGFFEFEIERTVVVKARVHAVIRSRANVRSGAIIEIPYTSVKRCSGYAGPRSIALLSKRDRVLAYLMKSDRGFAPAARGASFVHELHR